MCRAEVHVVVENGSVALRIVKECSHLRPYYRVEGEERAEEHYVVGIYLGISKLQLVVGMVLVKDVVGIVVVVKKSQGDR